MDHYVCKKITCNNNVKLKDFTKLKDVKLKDETYFNREIAVKIS